MRVTMPPRAPLPPEVVARLESIGARIYRTDVDGEVTLETDGSRVDVRTFLGGRP